MMDSIRMTTSDTLTEDANNNSSHSVSYDLQPVNVQLGQSPIVNTNNNNKPQIMVSSTVETTFSSELKAKKSSSLAIRVRNLTLTYGTGNKTNYVLNGVNMNVPKGAIYGLLGPSGCGKTTLLNLIIGLRKPEQGSVSIFGYPPGSQESGVPGPGIGYMPQEIALQMDLTIGEMLIYFARLYYINPIEAHKTIDYLIGLLELPSKHRLIKQLSGGQQRRVSLAVTIIHKPRVVILDEPTVGVDPLLCKRIWDLLVSLSEQQKMTIIITTHYIEEARRSNVVGFMRKGEILAEDGPEDYIERYSAKNLEEVFLRLCSIQKIRKSSMAVSFRKQSVNQKVIEKDIIYGGREPMEVTHTGLLSYLYVILTIVWKYCIQTFREPFASLLIFAFPPLALFMVCVCIGNTPKNIPVAWLVDEPNLNLIHSGGGVDVGGAMPTPASLMMIDDTATTTIMKAINNGTSIDYLSDVDTAREANNNDNNNGDDDYDPDLWEDVRPKAGYVYLPDILRESIDPDIVHLIDYKSVEDIRRDVKLKKIWGGIHLARNFSASYLQIDFFLQQADPNEWVSNQTVRNGQIFLIGDFSDKFLTISIYLSLQNSMTGFRNKCAIALGADPDMIQLPVAIPEVIYGGFVDGDYFGVRDFAAPGFVLLLVYTVSYAISLLSMIAELSDVMHVRSYAAGLSAFQIVIGQIIARFLFLGTSTIIILTFTIYVLGIPCHNSFLLALTLLQLQTLTGIAHGMLLGTLIPNLFIASFSTAGMLFFIFFVSGIFWPVDTLPYYLRWFSRSMPFTFPSEAFRSILIREQAPFHPMIWPGFVLTTIWFLIFTLLTVKFFKLTK